MYRLVALLVFVLMSASALAQKPTFVSVAPEPANHAWWLRAEYNPFSKAVRGVSVKLLKKNWCYVNEFRPELFPAEYIQEAFEGSGLSFSIDGRFDQRKKLTALVGAFETCENEKGLFLLILEQRGGIKVVRFLEAFLFQKSLAALRTTDRGSIELWWCSSCDNYQELIWDAKKKKFVWRAEDEGEEVVFINAPDLSRHAAPSR